MYGARDDVTKLLILITDGNPNRDTKKLDGEVEAIRAASIRVVVVAIGTEVMSSTCRRHRVNKGGRHCMSCRYRSRYSSLYRYRH